MFDESTLSQKKNQVAQPSTFNPKKNLRRKKGDPFSWLPNAFCHSPIGQFTGQGIYRPIGTCGFATGVFAGASVAFGAAVTAAAGGVAPSTPSSPSSSGAKHLGCPGSFPTLPLTL